MKDQTNLQALGQAFVKAQAEAEKALKDLNTKRSPVTPKTALIEKWSN